MFALTAAGVSAALLASGCGGGGSSSSSGTTAAAPAAATSSPASSPATTASAPAAATSGLSGSWNGQYGGAYHGTFALKWTQTGSSLAGTITLSEPHSTVPVHGTLQGSSIQFGTVGSVAITYTGSVSGSSMSGFYQTPAGGGSWSAAKG